MKRTCGTCGKEFEARSSRAKACSSTCRGRAHRAKKAGGTLIIAPLAIPSGSGLTAVVEETLSEAGRTMTPVGQLCLALAARIDAGAESSTGLAALSRELSARIEQALAGVADTVATPMDELRLLRERRRA